MYDVSSFVSRHPGGVDQIMLGAGRDVTQVFESYHSFETHKYVYKVICCKNVCVHVVETVSTRLKLDDTNRAII